MTNWHVLALFLAVVAAGTSRAEPPSDWQATYTVRQGAIEGGEAVQSYQAKAGHYRLQLDVRPGGVVAMFTQETFYDLSEGTVDRQGWRPKLFRHARSGGRKPRDYEYLFDWGSGQVTERQGERPPATLLAGTLDELIYVEALRRRLTEGATDLTVPVLYGSDGEIREYRLQVLGEEQISTPAGRFRTVKVERTQTGGKYTVTLWCAPDLDYFPVRIDRHKRGRAQGTLLLKSYRGGSRQVP